MENLIDYIAIAFAVSGLVSVVMLIALVLFMIFEWVRDNWWFDFWWYMNVTKPKERIHKEKLRKEWEEEFFKKWDKWMEDLE